MFGGLNVEPEETNIQKFLYVYNLRDLVKKKTCFKNVANPSCNDLILTKGCRSFQNAKVFETRLLDFH